MMMMMMNEVVLRLLLRPLERHQIGSIRHVLFGHVQGNSFIYIGSCLMSKLICPGHHSL